MSEAHQDPATRVADEHRDLMKWAEAESQRLDEQRRWRADRSLQIRKMHAPLAELFARTPHFVEGAVELQRMVQRQATRAPHATRRPPIPARTLSGSVLTVIPPPYPFQWPWSTGVAEHLEVRADRDEGDLFFDVYCGDEGGDAGVACAVGIPFQPPADGMLRFAGYARQQHSWTTGSVLWDPAHSDGWAGAFVSGRVAGPLVDQRTRLWWADSSSASSLDSDASDRTFTIDTGLIPVDEGDTYFLWIWCGGAAYGNGSHLDRLYGAEALASMDLSVPFLVTEFSG
jgi:hypothetical protein